MLDDLEHKAAGRQALTHSEALRVLGCADLVAVGTLAETARRAHHGNHVHYVQVLPLARGTQVDAGEAREIRLVGQPESFDEAAAWVREVVTAASGVPVTGFTMHHLLAMAGGDHLALAEGARTLREAGLSALAALAIDLVDDAAELVRACEHGGLPVPRVVVHDASSMDARLALISRVAALQADVRTIRVFAPLPEVDRADAPSTGYDDVRTIAVARLLCADVPSIQVDWSMYGPKLAQVAITYGADDIDGVAAHDGLALGQRRSPRVDIERQIVAAFASPVARDGRFEHVS